MTTAVQPSPPIHLSVRPRRWLVALLALVIAALLGACVYVLLPLSMGSGSALLDPADYFAGDGLRMARAVDRNDWDAIDKMVYEQGIDPDTIFDRQGRPLLAWPLLTYNPEGLHLLLNAGATPDIRMQSAGITIGPGAETSLVRAAAMADSRYLVELLMRGGDPNARNAAGQPLLYVAFSNGHWDNVQALIMSGAHLDTTLEDDGGYDTVLSWYSRIGRFDRLYWLLENGGDPTRRMRDVVGSRLAGTAESYDGRMPVVEDTFYAKVPEQMRDWQKACQAWLLTHNIGRPPAPPSKQLLERQMPQERGKNEIAL
ncbi:ankyrin repeat domain-containing protein [Pseudoxanthomonas sp. GM95]|uniref:ankyrin repeat domain-containing protein n=1 Tax=Pseudoxanthomonas sp. GM95 TaxID=1881043 RepID=UPI000B8A09D4|nr:ankyrin repeat domain-containing protein [Pseudoxanthomonas sp. GM95]